MLLSTTLRMVCCSDLVSVLVFDQTVSLLGALSLHVFALMECFLCSLPTIGVVSNIVELCRSVRTRMAQQFFSSVVQFGASGVGLYQGCAKVVSRS